MKITAAASSLLCWSIFLLPLIAQAEDEPLVFEDGRHGADDAAGDHVYRPESGATGGGFYSAYDRRLATMTCPDFAAAINTTGYSSFSRIVLQPLCPQGGQPNGEALLPDKVNWVVHAANADDALEVAMSPADVFTPIIQKGQLRFFLTQAPWKSGGEIGVEISFPVGLVTEFVVSGSGNGVDLKIMNPEGSSVRVSGQGNTVNINSTSTVNLSVNGSSNVVAGSAASFTTFVAGSSNSVQLAGLVTGGNVTGSSNSLLVQGGIAMAASDGADGAAPTPASYNVVGVGNTVSLNGGNCTAVSTASGNGTGDNVSGATTESTCTTTTEVVTAGAVNCTVQADGVTTQCQAAEQAATDASAAVAGYGHGTKNAATILAAGASSLVFLLASLS